MEGLALERNRTVLFFAARKTEYMGVNMEYWIPG